jgi:membrane-associated phospholipid phosphatase
MREWPIGLVLWLLVLACAEAAGFVLVWQFFVQSEHGQLLDAVALAGNSIGQARVEKPVDTVLNAMSALSLAIATVTVGFIAVMRRRIAVAFGAILLIVGANVTTQVLKLAIDRPELGVDVQRAAAGNSLPSGHTTIAASVAVAFMLVQPARLRGVCGVLGALFAAVAGVATLSAGWSSVPGGASPGCSSWWRSATTAASTTARRTASRWSRSPWRGSCCWRVPGLRWR